MILVPLIPCHVEGLTLQPGQDEMAEYMDQDGYSDMLSNLSGSYTLIDDGMVKGCGGLIEQGDGRALAWSLIGSNLNGFSFVSATRIVRNYIESSGYRRVEAIVKCTFKPGARWVELLGFKCETPEGMLNWFKDGTKAYLYARSTK